MGTARSEHLPPNGRSGMFPHMCALALQSIGKSLNAVVRLPGSKSLTNRALVIAALADGRTTLRGALLADDTRHMIDALRALSFHMSVHEDTCTVSVDGRGGHVPATEATLYCGNSGTTMRFCTALAALGMGTYRLEGTQRMHERPIATQVDALRQLGARVEYLGREGYPPLAVHATGLSGGQVAFRSPPSSQMISALLMVAACARNDVFIRVDGQLVSSPYVTMTEKVMEAFGVTTLSHTDDNGARYVVAAPQRYSAREYDIEPDASNASYFLAAPAVAGGSVTVEGLGTTSIQGDARFVDVLEQMGCRVEREANRLTIHSPGKTPSQPPNEPRASARADHRPEVVLTVSKDQPLQGIDVDLNDMPDMVQTLAVVALFATGPTRIRNVANLRLKETDRLHALARELGRLGATVEIRDDGLTIEPPPRIQPTTIATYDDHRMAMAFSLIGLVIDGISIDDPGCVAKTFPDFFDRWRRLAATSE